MSELIDTYSEKLEEVKQAVADEDPLNASTILQELTELVHDEHPETNGETPNYHRDNVVFHDRERSEEFIDATAHALQVYDETGDPHWLTVAACEIDGFRQVVLDQPSKELDWEPVDEDEL